MIGEDPLTHEELAALDKGVLWHPFTQMAEWDREDPVVIVSGEGNELIDDRGNRYLDGVSSLWVNIHGHRRREIDDAIIGQLGRIAHSTFLGLTHEPAIRLADRIIKAAPPGLRRVFFSDNGSTAVEVGLKMAFQYWIQRRDPRPGRFRFLTFRNAYHGDTLGSVSVGGIDLFHGTYRPLLFEAIRVESAYCYRCPLVKTHPACELACLDSVAQALQAHPGRVAAVIMEPVIQAAGGMIVFPPGYTRRVFELARAHEALFIADEVATGFGRTGALFACESEGFTPDILCVAKGITGGYLPLAATLTSEEIYEAFLGRHAEMKSFFHGHSYTANPLACAAALASLDLFEKDHVLEKVGVRVEEMRRGLEAFRSLEHVGDVRQAGLMAGIEIVRDRGTREGYPVEERIGHRVILAARRRGLIIRPLGDVVVLMPPLSLSGDELGRMLSITRDAILEVTG